MMIIKSKNCTNPRFSFVTYLKIILSFYSILSFNYAFKVLVFMPFKTYYSRSSKNLEKQSASVSRVVIINLFITNFVTSQFDCIVKNFLLMFEEKKLYTLMFPMVPDDLISIRIQHVFIANFIENLVPQFCEHRLRVNSSCHQISEFTAILFGQVVGAKNKFLSKSFTTHLFTGTNSLAEIDLKKFLMI